VNNLIKKGLVIGIICLLILVSVPTVVSEGKPDLVIEDMVIKPGNFPNEQEFFCRVKNIGDVIAEKTIFVSVDIRMCFLFGMLPVYLIGTFDGGGNFVPGLFPGDTIDIVFAYSYDLPRFGFYLFSCEVNPQLTIDEGKYSNNFYSEKSFAIFGNWRY